MHSMCFLLWRVAHPTHHRLLQLITTTRAKPAKGLQSVAMPIGGEPWHVSARPGLQSFLEAAAAHFDVGIFTASPREIAERKIDWIDSKGLIRQVSCP